MTPEEIESKIALAESLLGLMKDPRWEAFAKAVRAHRDTIVRKVLNADLANPGELARFQGEVRMLTWLTNQESILERDLASLRTDLTKLKNDQSGSSGVPAWSNVGGIDRDANLNPFGKFQ